VDKENMNQDQDEQQLDNQGENQNITPSGDEQDQDSNQDTGDQGNDDQDTNGEQGQAQTRQERRRDRYEAFQRARVGFQETDEQRQQSLKQDPYKPLTYGKGAEYDVTDLEKDRQQFGDSRYAEGVKLQRFYDQQERYHDRIETDSDWVANKYSFLDEDSDDFDPELNKAITELFFEAAAYNPKTHVFNNTNIRYKPFVQRYVQSMQKFASGRSDDSIKPRPRTGVQPSGPGRKPPQLSWKNPGEMTDDELKAHINASLGI
jgi:hypothetical protein